MTITVKYVEESNGFRSQASLYKLSEPVEYGIKWNDDDPPLQTTQYVIISSVVTLQFHGDGPETYIFPADKNGNIIDWCEMDGSLKGTMSHDDAIEAAGWANGGE